MGFFEGLLGGFSDRKGDVEERNFKLGQQQSQQESAIFSHLMSSDDPEVRTLALTGLLDTANPRRKAKGLKGWIGETQASPYLEQMRTLIRTPVQEKNPAVGALPPDADLSQSTLPARQSAAGVAMPNVQPAITESQGGTPSAGMPTNSPVQPGTGAPPTPVSYTQAPPTPFTVSRMRNVFLTGADKVRADAIATAGGKAEGSIQELMLGGKSREQATEIWQRSIERQYGGGVAGSTYAEGNTVPDPKSPTGYSQLLYQRGDPTKQMSIPALDPTRAHTNFYGKDLESISGEPAFGGKPFGSQDPEGKARVNAEFQRRQVSQAGLTSEQRALGTGRGQIQTDLNKPIGPSAAQQYNVAPTTPLKDLVSTIGLTESEKTKISSLGAADESVQKIGDLIKEVFPTVAPGAIGGMQSAITLGWKKFARDEDLASLDTAINLAAVNIARVAGETGRIPVQLVDKAVGALGSIHPDMFGGDTQATALAKLKVVQDLLETARAYAPGAGVSGGPPRLNGVTPPARAAAPAGPPNVFHENTTGRLYQLAPDGTTKQYLDGKP